MASPTTNRTIKKIFFKYFSANISRKFVDVLVDQYNYAIYSSIKMTPKEASRQAKEIKCGEIYV